MGFGEDGKWKSDTDPWCWRISDRVDYSSAVVDNIHVMQRFRSISPVSLNTMANFNANAIAQYTPVSRIRRLNRMQPNSACIFPVSHGSRISHDQTSVLALTLVHGPPISLQSLPCSHCSGSQEIFSLSEVSSCLSYDLFASSITISKAYGFLRVHPRVTHRHHPT